MVLGDTNNIINFPNMVIKPSYCESYCPDINGMVDFNVINPDGSVKSRIIVKFIPKYEYIINNLRINLLFMAAGVWLPIITSCLWELFKW